MSSRQRRAGHVRRRVPAPDARTVQPRDPRRLDGRAGRGRGRPGDGGRLVDGTEIRAGWVVLAAGTYGSPTILMRSGIGPAGAPRRPRHRRPGRASRRGRQPGRPSGGRPRLRLAGPGDDRSDPPLDRDVPKLRASTGGAPDLMFWISDPEGDEPGFWFDPVLLKPRSRGSVRLRSSDPAASAADHAARAFATPPTSSAWWRGTGSDWSSPIDQRSGDCRRRSPPSEPSTPEEWRRRVLENAYSIPHVVGTCAMGPSPDGGDVVDALGRVHGVERLSVVDASIIPEPRPASRTS